MVFYCYIEKFPEGKKEQGAKRQNNFLCSLGGGWIIIHMIYKCLNFYELGKE